MSQTAPNETDRVPPLNLTAEEADYLWEMVKEEVGKREVQYGDDREIAESLHTKVGTVAGKFVHEDSDL